MHQDTLQPVLLPRPIPRAARAALLRPALVGLSLAALGLGCYLLHALLGWDPFRLKGLEPGQAIRIYQAIAALLALIGLGGAAAVVHSHLHMIRYGLQVEARFVSHSASTPTNQLIKATVQYTLAGRHYTATDTVAASAVQDLCPGDPVPLFVHPRKPHRTLILWDLPADLVEETVAH